MKIFNYLFLLMISLYRKVFSPFLPPTCRFTPTCSEYSRQAFMKYNFIKAFWLMITRIARCHPFNKGGFDPLP